MLTTIPRLLNSNCLFILPLSSSAKFYLQFRFEYVVILTRSRVSSYHSCLITIPSTATRSKASLKKITKTDLKKKIVKKKKKKSKK